MFREAVVTLACEGSPLDARDRLIVVPTRAAAAQLTRSIEARVLPLRGAVVLPDLATPRELTLRLGERLGGERRMLTGHEREVLLGVACRAVRDGGCEPPFRLRPALMAEILTFYDELRRRQNLVDDFERRALSQLEPGAADDRGAERLVRQTRFLAAAFRDFERRSAEQGSDEHQLRARLIAQAADQPYRHIVLTVTDAAFDAHGLFSAEWDLLARVPGLDRLDVVATDTMIAGALHERLHQVLPGIEEVRFEVETAPAPVLVVPGETEVRLPSTALGPGKSDVTTDTVHRARDREEEIASFARRVKAAARSKAIASLDRAALVVKQPLPYVYLARDVLRSAAIPCQMFDALPLAAEPYAAALDLVFSCVSANGARLPAIALLRSPHFQFAAGDEGSARDVMALDRALAEAGYLGEVEALERLVDEWNENRAARAGKTLSAVLRNLLPLASPAPVASHLTVLTGFLRRYDRDIDVNDPLAARQLRARGAIHATLRALRDAYARFDEAPVDADVVAALVRRWIDGQTFAPRTGESGVHVLDASSAVLGQFEFVQLAGVMDGEWPERPRRNIFYSTGVLRELGWSSESDRLDGERAAFADLLTLATSRVAVSVFTLEADALVSPSPFIDEVERAALATRRDTSLRDRIFDFEALACPEGASPIEASRGAGDHMRHPAIALSAREWAARRRPRTQDTSPRFRGQTDAHDLPALSLSALERYQDCPFKFFAADVLRLEEAPEEESMLSPRARGRFIHEVFERFFAAWDANGRGAITYARLDEARALMREVAETQLARLPDADAALERTRLFGSAISRGMADVVLEHEVEHQAPVVERLLEHRFEGEFALGSADGRRARLKGVADRIDLLEGRRLRVFDYKSGSAPDRRRALQVPIYALSAQEQLAARDGKAWSIDEAAYLAFTGKKSYVPIVSPGGTARDNPLEAARERVFEITEGIAAGAFPPRPHEPIRCTWCAYPSVCRKDDIDAD
ncbi:MAG TPA: PD-(D/E)XK nuclease family protein [Vicinamibacterales bacterium]